jgi:hypothetical protein
MVLPSGSKGPMDEPFTFRAAVTGAKRRDGVVTIRSFAEAEGKFSWW